MSHDGHRPTRVHRMSPPHVHSRNGRRHTGLLHIRNNDYRNSNGCKSIQLTSNSSRRGCQMRNPSSMSHRFHLPIYSRRSNRNRPSQFIPRYRSPRHLLRRSAFPLCPIYGSCLRHRCCLRTLIPTIYRIHPTQHMN